MACVDERPLVGVGERLGDGVDDDLARDAHRLQLLLHAKPAAAFHRLRRPRVRARHARVVERPRLDQAGDGGSISSAGCSRSRSRSRTCATDSSLAASIRRPSAYADISDSHSPLTQDHKTIRI